MALVAQRRVEPLPTSPSAPAIERSERVAEEIDDSRFLELSYRRWLDDPQHELSGLSPRRAASHPEHRATIERQLRSIEHCSARERPDGEPGPEVSWLRAELALARPLAA